MNVVLTREAGRNGLLREWLPPEATVNEVPLTTTSYFERDDVRASLEASSSHVTYRSVVVTSERSADYVEIALEVSSPDVELFVVGPATEAALSARGIGVHARGEGSAESLAPMITRGPVLVVGAKSMREELVVALRAKGLDVDTLACYETLPVTLDPGDTALLRDGDVIFIGAPSAWTVASAYVPSRAWVIVPGASTAAAVRVEHPNVIEGWGPHLRTRLGELSI